MPKPKINIDLTEEEPINDKAIQKKIEPSKTNHVFQDGNFFQRTVEKLTSKLHDIKSDEKPEESMAKKAKKLPKRPLVVPVPDSMINLNGKKNDDFKVLGDELEDEEITETDESDSDISVGQDQLIPEENFIGKY